MIIRRNRKANHVPLVVEPHPENYNGYPFITLIQYREKQILAVVDNATEKTLRAYVLDLCGPEGLNEEIVVSIIADWYDKNGEKYPLSVEFSRLGVANKMSKICRTYNLEYVTRLIGPMPKFNMTETISIKRRRRKGLPPGMELKNRTSFQLGVYSSQVVNVFEERG